MIICRQCGAESAEGDDFCGTCGVFLEWEGERVDHAEPEPEAGPVVDPDAPHRPTLVERVKTVIGLDEDDPVTAARADEAAARPAGDPVAPPTPLPPVEVVEAVEEPAPVPEAPIEAQAASAATVEPAAPPP
ncbi:MAG: hypothetical protein ACRDZW_07675, partial [Acidimicrobiales bacterium]